MRINVYILPKGMRSGQLKHLSSSKVMRVSFNR